MNYPLTGTLFWVLAALLLTGCGGGGGGDDDDGDDDPPLGRLWVTPPAPPADPGPGAPVEGVFKDANVSGLAFDSGSQTGVTGVDGVFRYESGTPVTFRIGAVEFGSATGQPLMTPVNLVLPSNIGGPLTQQIQNRLRFLQALDLDGNPANGIEISAAVRNAAQSWPQVDFTSDDIASAVLPLLADASAADGVTHSLPSAAAADAHFVPVARCAYSGLYRGTFAGSDSGVFAMSVDPIGRVFGMSYSNIDRSGILLENTGTLALSIFPRLRATELGSGPTVLNGQFDSPDVVSGSWTAGSETGTFRGARSNGTRAAVYRLSGHVFPQGTALLITLEIDAGNGVRGAVIDLDSEQDGSPSVVQGTLNGTQLAAESSAYALTGTFDRAAAAGQLRLTGTLTDRRKSRTIQLTSVNGGLPGCRLN